MSFIKINPNPRWKEVGDCTVRAISLATNKPWEEIYVDLCLQGYKMGDMPSANAVWGRYLVDKGYKCQTCELVFDGACTVSKFAENHPKGIYILATGTHVVCVKDGNYLDAWDSGEIPIIYYFFKEGEKKDGDTVQ